MMRRIGVIGAGLCDPDTAKIAEKVGGMIAGRGAILYCGGLGGVMEAAAKGAFEAGGVTVGILPGSKAAEANRYIKIPIVTDMGYARNVILVKSCEVLIAISGSYGTLAEISLALKMWKPVVGLKTWENFKGVNYVTNADEAIEKAFEMLP
ncbi:MAG: TIGR00725 family protein [Desulfobacteraceae bacterium]|nr:TIGR00725 family protein [Desulfobacteraceae bacterium]